MCVLLWLAGKEKFINLLMKIISTYIFQKKHLFIVHVTLLNLT